jgi:TolA-binding protein
MLFVPQLAKRTGWTAEAAADRAKLKEAEALYQRHKYADAAPLYEDLRASQLPPKLRAEACYKLGCCFVQLQDTLKTEEAFTYFIAVFPDNPQLPAALTQRAVAYQQEKAYDHALADWAMICTRYPQAHEREAALQQWGLLMAQMGKSEGMSMVFRQLLKEFPKTNAAAQAQYYIGMASLKAKDCKTAITCLKLMLRSMIERQSSGSWMPISRSRGQSPNRVFGFFKANCRQQRMSKANKESAALFWMLATSY